MKNAKIRLLTDCGTHIWLTINYFSKRHGGGVDNYCLTDNACLATVVPLKDTRKWMHEAKTLARFDGDVIEKGEYILDGKPTTLTAVGLINSK